MKRFLVKTLEMAASKAREAVELQEEGSVQSIREASQKVAQRTMVDFQRKLAQIRALPQEQRTAEFRRLTREWGVQELMERWMPPR